MAAPRGAWDVYVEPRRHLVSWELPGGRGRIEIPRGSGVTAAAADAAGRFVAYGTTSQLNIGSTADTVVVLRASDAAELMRRRFPRYHRSHVALLGAGQWFVLTDIDAGVPRVRVYALPSKESPR